MHRVATLMVIAVAAMLLLAGCKTIPQGRSAVDDVRIRGAQDIDGSDVLEKLATSPSPRFAGVFRGVVNEYSTLDRFVLQRDLARVEAFYQTQGYYLARARAGRVHQVNDKHVEVEIIVDEGEPVRIHEVQILGLESLPPQFLARAKKVAAKMLVLGAPFTEKAFDKAKAVVQHELADRGYAHSKVDAAAKVDITTNIADVVMTVEVGPECVFGELTIEGLGALPEAPVRRALAIEAGKRFSLSALEDAQQAALDLGVFASVVLTPIIDDKVARVIPIKVATEVSRLRTVQLGAGIQLNATKSSVHGLVGWQSRNFLGGMRSLSIDFRPGVALYPVRVNNIVAPEQLMPEERLRVELRQPGLFEARTNGFIRPEFNVYPLLLSPNPPSDARVIGYVEGKGSVGADRAWWKLYVALSHNAQVAYPFAYRGSRDPTLGLLTIFYPELSLRLDFRDDRVRPRKGFLLGSTFQMAGFPFGGQADDVKVVPEVRTYVPIVKNKLTWAARSSVGFLWARSYGDRVQRTGTTNTFDTPSESLTRDYQLTYFRGFFSGGATSNRGYPYRGISPHANIPAVAPEGQASALTTGCDGGDCRVPAGGFTLWELSTELRWEITGPFAAVAFCDASDVSPRQANIRLAHLHLSCGAGARYDTPVGPIRLDVGYRIPGLQVLGGLTPDEKEPNTFPLGIPIALGIGIGEAY